MRVVVTASDAVDVASLLPIDFDADVSFVMVNESVGGIDRVADRDASEDNEEDHEFDHDAVRRSDVLPVWSFVNDFVLVVSGEFVRVGGSRRDIETDDDTDQDKLNDRMDAVSSCENENEAVGEKVSVGTMDFVAVASDDSVFVALHSCE